MAKGSILRSTVMALSFILLCIGFAQAAQGLPGDTHADLRLQTNTLPTVYMMAAEDFNEKCQGMQVIDTVPTSPLRHVKKANGHPVKGDWDEDWVVSGCGKITKVKVTFGTDGQSENLIHSSPASKHE